MSQKQSNAPSIILAGLIGGLVGAAVGLMLAPKPGKELRRDLAAEGRELLNDMQQFLEDVRGEKDPDAGDTPNLAPEAGEK